MSNLDKFENQRESKLDELFGTLPVESEIIVKLPSEGRFYPSLKPTVTITPIKFEDEKRMAINLKNKLNPINIILANCVPQVDISSLLILDKLFILLKLREISYGEKYPASITCPNCDNSSDVNIDLSKLIVNYIPEEITDPREFILPKLKKSIKVRFPRVKDEEYLGTQEATYSNIWRFVLELNGVTDPIFINKAIPKMHIMDVKTILSNILRPDLGLEPKFIFECGSCSVESTISIPINENFFLVT